MTWPARGCSQGKSRATPCGGKKSGEALAMGKGYRFFETFALGLALTCAVLASQPAYAGLLTLSGPSSITITEGASSSPQTFTFTNNSGGDVSLQGFGHTFAPPSPDPTDVAGTIVAHPGTTPCILGNIIANGKSCTFEVTWTTDSPAGETDHDSGTTSEMFTLHTSGGGAASTSVPVTVNDPPPSPVPEPASVVLLGSSLLGALGLLRRKLL